MWQASRQGLKSATRFNGDRAMRASAHNNERAQQCEGERERKGKRKRNDEPEEPHEEQVVRPSRGKGGAPLSSVWISPCCSLLLFHRFHIFASTHHTPHCTHRHYSLNTHRSLLTPHHKWGGSNPTTRLNCTLATQTIRLDYTASPALLTSAHH